MGCECRRLVVVVGCLVDTSGVYVLVCMALASGV